MIRRKNDDVTGRRDRTPVPVDRRLKRLVVASAFMVWASLEGISGPKAANSMLDPDFVARIDKLIETKLDGWIDDPTLLAAAHAQNARHAKLSQSDIDRLDRQWRAEISQRSRPLIDEIMSRQPSHHLQSLRSSTEGLVTEIILIDRRGLNIGLSDVTSDYWQGDEAKWRRIVDRGPDARFIDEVEWDDSSERFQSQVSLPIVDDDVVIGVITFGIDADQLENDPAYDRTAIMPAVGR